MRSNGPGREAIIIEYESGTIQLETTLDEMESAIADLALEIDADVILDEVMESLIEYLNTNCDLEVPV